MLDEGTDMSAEIKAIIESVVRERLADAQIQKVIVKEDKDYEGDRIFRVMIVFDATKGKLDSHRISGLARHLRSKLEETDAFSHPIFRFVSQSDAKKLLPEAA